MVTTFEQRPHAKEEEPVVKSLYFMTTHTLTMKQLSTVHRQISANRAFEKLIFLSIPGEQLDCEMVVSSKL